MLVHVMRAKVGCKKILGQTICQVGSAVIIPKHPIVIDVYQSHDCGMCPGEIKGFKKKLDKLNGFAKVNVRDIEDVNNMNLLGTLPVVDFGNGVIERGNVSKMEERDIIGKIIESARNGEIMRSISS